MMRRIRNGEAVIRASWEVLRHDRELLLLPVISMLASIALLAVVVLGLFMDEIRAIPGGTDPALLLTTGDCILLTFRGFALAYVGIFFNVAIVCAADERMRGGEPTLGGAIREAASHGRRILPWAIVSATVSLVLRAIEERAGFVGRIVVGFLGLAWALVTYLILPILVIEGLGVRDALGRSKELFTRTWGETVTGELGINLLAFCAMLLALPFLLLVGGGGQPELVAAAVVLGVAWCLIVGVVASTLSMIFRVALYRFAADGEAPEAFAHLDLGRVFPERRKSFRLG